MNRQQRRQIERELGRIQRQNIRRRERRQDVAFVGAHIEMRAVPHEPGNEFKFRALSGPELDEADIAGTRRAAEQMKVLPDSVVNQAMAKDDGKEQTRDAFRGYDKAVLVKYGVVGWEGPEYNRECDDANKALLDARTHTWAARVIFEMNVRPEGEGSGSDSSLSTEKLSPTN